MCPSQTRWSQCCCFGCCSAQRFQSMFWVMALGLTSASPQANMSEQTLKKQWLTSSLRATVCEIISQRDTVSTGEKGICCAPGMISLQSLVLILLFQSYCGVWGRENQLPSFLERIDMVLGEYTMQLYESVSIQTLQRSKHPLQSAQLHHKNGFCLSFLCSPDWLTSFLHCIFSPLHFSFILKYFVRPRNCKNVVSMWIHKPNFCNFLGKEWILMYQWVFG